MKKLFGLLACSSRKVKVHAVVVRSYSPLVRSADLRSISTTFTSLRKHKPKEVELEMSQEQQEYPEIVFVTGNKHKLREFTQILGDGFPYTIMHQGIDLPEYQGEPDQVTRLKCQSAYEIIKRPVLVEDTCLCFNALGGLPGPYVKHFLEKVGPDGLFKMLQGFDDHSAIAIASIAYCDGNVEKIKIFQGMTFGTIVNPRGGQRLGWNVWPFIPDGCDLTFAEMSPDAKNKISHRKRAVEVMRKYFLENSGLKSG